MRDVIVIGAGPAGLSASVFTSRNGMDTLILESRDSILRRNAHLENFLGFPKGVNSNLLLEMGRDQAEESGCDIVEGFVTGIEIEGDAFTVETRDGETHEARHIIVATKNETRFLPGDVETYQDGKTFIKTDGEGRTSVDRLYAAGRVAGKPHQTIISAGHGAEVAVTLLEDENPDFYRDWVVPKGYFTMRGREVPGGCEEIEEEERRRREEESIKAMKEYFSELFSRPDQHPSVGE